MEKIMRFRFRDKPGTIILPVSKHDCACSKAHSMAQSHDKQLSAMARFKVASRDRWRVQGGAEAVVGHLDAAGLTPYQRFAARSREKQATA